MSDKDTIYRQAAIDALAEYIHNVDKVIGTGHLTADDCKDAAYSVLEKLPSAQPEIIRCKDCVHYYVGYPYDCCSLTDKCAEENDFCSWAERPRRWNK